MIRRCPLAFYQLPADMLDTILMFAVAGMGLQERLALKAALGFMVCINVLMCFFCLCYITFQGENSPEGIVAGRLCWTGI